MVLIPRPGLALIRPVTTQDTLPGGRIVLTANTKQYLIGQQAELLDIGTRAEDDDYQYEDEADNPWESQLRHLRGGDWLLLRHRTWIPTDVPERFLVRHEDILAKLND